MLFLIIFSMYTFTVQTPVAVIFHIEELHLVLCFILKSLYVLGFFVYIIFPFDKSNSRVLVMELCEIFMTK